MIGITPVGIITTQPEASRKFYREVMEVERVQQMRQPDGDDGLEDGFLLKLESPRLEIFSIETRLLDRLSNRVIRRDYSLLLHPRDTKDLLEKLATENVELKISAQGKMVFEDLTLGMSADAPVLVVRPIESETFLGGAGIVAQHVQSLGANVRFCTVIGQDAEGEYVRRELEQRGVPFDLVVDSSRPTTLKTRYLCENKKLLNVNQFRDHNLDTVIEGRLKEKLGSFLDTADALVICDFGYGVITASLLEYLCDLGRKRNIPIVGDVQCSSQIGNVTRMKGITLIAPSEKEARMALCDRESGIADLGAMILTQTGNRSLLITMAERGLMVFEPEGGPFNEESRALPLHEIKKRLTTEYLPPFAAVAIDPMGAGDAMLAAISCALAAGATVMESAFLGNCAAGVEVGKMGNVPVGRKEFLEVVASRIGILSK